MKKNEEVRGIRTVLKMEMLVDKKHDILIQETEFSTLVPHRSRLSYPVLRDERDRL